MTAWTPLDKGTGNALQGAWLSRFPFCTLGWSHLEVTHAHGRIATWEKGLKIGNSPSLLKRSCQIHYFAKDKYIFFYLFMFLFQWTNLRRRLCGSLPTCVLLQLQITSMAQLIAQLYLKTYDHLFIWNYSFSETETKIRGQNTRPKITGQEANFYCFSQDS